MKQCRLLIPIAVLACCAPAAHAEPSQWADNRVAIPAGETVELGAAGTLKIRTLSAKGQVVLSVACSVSSTQTFRNESEHGQGEVKTITFNCGTDTSGACAGSAVQVEAAAGWPAVLEASPSFYLDEWHNVALAIKCGSTDLGTSTGTLTPKIGDVDDVGNFLDDIDDHLLFGPTRGTLIEPLSGDKTQIVGGNLLIEGKRIQAWRFPGGTMTRFSGELD